MKIPQANTLERETFNGTVLGTINRENGQTRCLNCCNLGDVTEHILDRPTIIYGINVAPYSLVCHVCHVLIVDGLKKSDGTPLDIYETH